MKKYGTRWGYYLLGLCILALGICLTTKIKLGASPLISVAYCFSERTGMTGISFPVAMLLLYLCYVAVEIVIHFKTGKKKRIFADLLQIPLCIVFYYFTKVFEWIIPEITPEKLGSIFGSMPSRIIFLIIAIILTGIGAALSMNARLVPNPGDGIVQAISDVWGKSTGFTKNVMDCGSVLFTSIIGLIFVRKVYLNWEIVGIGTILAMIGVGRVMAIFNHFTKVKIARASGVDLELDPKANAKQAKKDYKEAGKAADQAEKVAKKEAKEAKEAKKEAKEAEKAVKLAKQEAKEAKEAAKGSDNPEAIERAEAAAQALKDAEKAAKEAEKTAKKEIKEAKEAKADAKEAEKLVKEAKKEAKEAKKLAKEAEKEAKEEKIEKTEKEEASETEEE